MIQTVLQYVQVPKLAIFGIADPPQQKKPHKYIKQARKKKRSIRLPYLGPSQTQIWTLVSRNNRNEFVQWMAAPWSKRQDASRKSPQDLANERVHFCFCHYLCRLCLGKILRHLFIIVGPFFGTICLNNRFKSSRELF